MVSFFLDEDTVTGQRYMQMLDENVLPVLANCPDVDNLIFQQDGAQPHFAVIARACVDSKFSWDALLDCQT